jgi:hypothetical protein
LGDSALKNKLQNFKGSHADYLIAEALRIKVERELKLKQKEAEELKTLREKPEIPSLAKKVGRKLVQGLLGDKLAEVQDERAESTAAGPKRGRTFRSPEVVV